MTIDRRAPAGQPEWVVERVRMTMWLAVAVFAYFALVAGGKGTFWSRGHQ